MELTFVKSFVPFIEQTSLIPRRIPVDSVEAERERIERLTDCQPEPHPVSEARGVGNTVEFGSSLPRQAGRVLALGGEGTVPIGAVVSWDVRVGSARPRRRMCPLS